MNKKAKDNTKWTPKYSGIIKTAKDSHVILRLWPVEYHPRNFCSIRLIQVHNIAGIKPVVNEPYTRNGERVRNSLWKRNACLFSLVQKKTYIMIIVPNHTKITKSFSIVYWIGPRQSNAKVGALQN